MASENVELVRRAIKLFNQRKVEEALSAMSEDIVMDWTNSIGPLKGVYSGRDEVMGFWQAFLEAWESVEWDPRQIFEVDDERLIVVNTVRMQGRGSGVPVEATGVQLWTIEGGLGRSVKLFQSKEEALEAVSG